MTVRVVLVDDQALVRVGLRTLFASAPDIEVVGEAAGGIEALAVVAHTRPTSFCATSACRHPTASRSCAGSPPTLRCEMSAS
ncbi:response regulator transcription factor [Rhodococcus sp. Rp3]|uniref:response regulator transcription factor n=1 Tax=Rhodococcus sp. Rp3 TaxID=2807635 RepID=UPI002FEE1318